MPGLFVVDAFLQAAQEMSIPVLSLPHGIFLYTNEVTKAKSTDSRRFSKFNRFDYIIVPNRLRKELLTRSGVAKEKIFVLGSARFCNEWLEQNNKIIPRMMESNLINTGKLKLVFMPSKPRCRIDVERMRTTIEILASFGAIEAVVKPHTRTGREKHVFSNMPLANVTHILTPELCEWADVVLVIGTSVITEALIRGKPALYLKYLHANTTLFEELGACWTIHDEAELKESLSSLQVDKREVPYSEENTAKFVEEIVYGGNENKDVLSTYEQFIVSCASN
jgi:UDP-N-acetylglucosamine 2-epimerase